MLLAEIHGKYEPAAREHEDYLTSTVFSHLRYIPPGPFWERLLSRAKTNPIQGREEWMTDVLGEHSIADFDNLNVLFWPSCPKLGEPELALCFTGGNQQPLVVLVEVKLWAGKSGMGDNDQLMRYLRIADAIGDLKPQVPEGATVVVMYLTPRESINEVQESLEQYGDSEPSRRRLFRLQWQDVIEAALEKRDQETGISRTILDDVIRFLQVRGLEKFKGFKVVKDLDCLESRCGGFYHSSIGFNGFQTSADLAEVRVVKGEW